jgi:CDP-glycerol glycerophosphotransferase (TagB/SpsB family)
VGYPKVDCLVDGSLDRRAIQAQLGLDPSRPTVLYAPTWSPHSSLNAMGDDIIRGLVQTGSNVIVKLHDRSYDAAARASGGVDWRSHLKRTCAESGVHLAEDPDVSPYLMVADALVTDHSSVGFEFMLLDRPIVVVDCPELIEKARVNPDKVTMLRSVAEVVERADQVPAAVERGLSDPGRFSERRRFLASELFYCPGGATARATQCGYDLLELAAPEQVSEAHPSDVSSSFTHLKQGALKCVQ